MAQAAAPWYPRLVPGCLKNMGKYETFENNTIYYKFRNSDGKGITVEVNYAAQTVDACICTIVFNAKVRVPAKEGIDFATKGTDIALYPEDHREYIASIINPVVNKFLSDIGFVKPVV